MKKVAILLALFCMLTVTASAAYIPEDVISENRDGRQLIIKTYMLPPDADPSGLVEEPFEVEGYSYHHLETVKEEQTFEDSKIQTEVVTLETDVDDLAAILEQLDASMEYNKDGYSGVLTLDHTTIQTEAAGYGTTINAYLQSYRIHTAAGLLRETKLDVTEIAGRVGYQNASKFSEVFRQHTGHTPTEYRKSFCLIGADSVLREW